MKQLKRATEKHTAWATILMFFLFTWCIYMMDIVSQAYMNGEFPANYNYIAFGLATFGLIVFLREFYSTGKE